MHGSLLTCRLAFEFKSVAITTARQSKAHNFRRDLLQKLQPATEENNNTIKMPTRLKPGQGDHDATLGASMWDWVNAGHGGTDRASLTQEATTHASQLTQESVGDAFDNEEAAPEVSPANSVDVENQDNLANPNSADVTEAARQNLGEGEGGDEDEWLDSSDDEGDDLPVLQYVQRRKARKKDATVEEKESEAMMEALVDDNDVDEDDDIRDCPGQSKEDKVKNAMHHLRIHLS